MGCPQFPVSSADATGFPASHRRGRGRYGFPRKPSPGTRTPRPRSVWHKLNRFAMFGRRRVSRRYAPQAHLMPKLPIVSHRQRVTFGLFFPFSCLLRHRNSSLCFFCFFDFSCSALIHIRCSRFSVLCIPKIFCIFAAKLEYRGVFRYN